VEVDGVTQGVGKAPRSLRNLATGLVLSGVVCAMVGLSFAAVPLYRLFCQVTGFGGTTQVAEAAPEAVAERVMTVRFNADTAADLPWRFQPVARAMQVRVGEPGLAVYHAANLSAQPVNGTAVFNVTPLKAGQYFSKVQCFCFDEQRLGPGETADMAVSFFIDPAILEDRNLDDVKTITLSYTFFRSVDGEAAPEERAGKLEVPAATLVSQQSAARPRTETFN
jgi:cytochrome c oxidase assembly protein subunit 11